MHTIEVTSINIKAVTGEPPVCAYCSIVLNESFCVRKIRIISHNDQFAVFMPSMKNKDGKYSDICHPINQEVRNKIVKAILHAYIGQLKSTVE